MSQEIKEAIRDKTNPEAEPNASAVQEPQNEEEDFGALLEAYMVIPRKGQTLDCVVTDINSEGIQLNLSSKQTGLIPSHRVAKSDEINVGDTVRVTVTRAESDDPYVYCDLVRTGAWDALEKARHERTIVECLVTRINRGGIETEYKGVHVFIPGSKSGMDRNEDKSGLIGKTVRVRILETDKKTRRIIGSIRADREAVLQENIKKLWANLAPGQKYEGTVRNLTEFAAFIDIGGVDGLAHVSQLSYEHIEQPSDILTPGDKVTVWVTRLDKDRKRLNLTLKDPDRDPWKDFAKKHQPEEILPGTVRGVTHFGAFVSIAPSIEGLVHVSQISYDHIDHPGELLSDGDSVNVKILSIDPENKRIALSMKGISQPE